MKTLGVLSAICLFFMIFCCGIGALFAPRSRQVNSAKSNPSPQSKADTPASPNDSSEPRNSDAEADRVYEQRNQEYQSQLSAWRAAKAKHFADTTELSTLEASLAEHMANEPKPPVFELRKWSTWDNKFSTMATLLETDNVTAKIKKADGNEVEVPKEKLVAADRVYIENAFVELTDYDAETATWSEARDKLSASISEIRKRVELGLEPEPKAPDRSEIAGEIAAARAARERSSRLAREKAQADAVANAVANEQKRAQKEIDAYAAVIRTADPEGALIKSIRSKGDELIITVSNAWHFQPYQIRLQLAQSLWEGWANVHSRSEPDRARLSLVDFNGNEVGGSRVWAGSLIWVQDK